MLLALGYQAITVAEFEKVRARVAVLSVRVTWLPVSLTSRFATMHPFERRFCQQPLPITNGSFLKLVLLDLWWVSLIHRIHATRY